MKVNGKEAIGMSISTPQQAMEIINGLLEIVQVAAVAFSGIAKLVESGDTAKALELLRTGSEAVSHRAVDVIEGNAKRLSDEELAEAALEKTKGGEPRITEYTKCAGNA